MDELKLFQEFLNNKKLSIESIDAALKENDIALKAALNAGHFQSVYELKTQRDELKNTLIDLLKEKLAA